MTAIEFQQKHGQAYRDFINSDLGKAFLETLENLHPIGDVKMAEHQMVFVLGGREGYEDCIRKIRSLGVPAREIKQPRQDYGIHQKPEIDPDAKGLAQ